MFDEGWEGGAFGLGSSRPNPSLPLLPKLPNLPNHHSRTSQNATSLFLAACDYYRKHESDHAEACLRQALAYDENFAPALGLLGLMLVEADNTNPEIQSLAQRSEALPINNQYSARFLGKNFLFSGDMLKARHYYSKALEFKPIDPASWTYIGFASLELGDKQMALESVKQALQLKEYHSAGSIGNCAIILRDLRHFEGAMTLLERLAKDYPHQSFSEFYNLVIYMIEFHILAKQQPIAKRDVRYEARRLNYPYAQLSYRVPDWVWGQTLQDRHILLYLEGGYGDFFQTVRYLPLVLAQGPRKITLFLGRFYRALAELCASLPSQIEIVESITDQSQMVNPFVPPSATLTAKEKFQRDHQYNTQEALLALPWRFDLSQPLITPPDPSLLVTSPAKQEEWLSQLQAWRIQYHQGRVRPLIGLNFRGNTGNHADHRRTIHLKEALPCFAPLFSKGDYQFILLQRDFLAEEMDYLQQWPQIWPVGSQIHSFADSAAILSQLELLITVDTGLAHLAGNLLKHVWMLLPINNDIRWPDEGETTAWYPTMHLWRQSIRGEWSQILHQLVRKLMANPQDNPISSIIAPHPISLITKASKLAEQDYFAAAETAIGQGKEDVALAIYRENLQAHPENAETLARIGLMLVYQDKNDKELSSIYNQLTTHKDRTDNVIKFLGIATIDRKEFLASRHWSALYLSIYPQDDLMWSLLARTAIELGDTDLAHECVKRIFQINAKPNARIVNNVLTTLLDLGLFTQAEAMILGRLQDKDQLEIRLHYASIINIIQQNRLAKMMSDSSLTHAQKWGSYRLEQIEPLGLKIGQIPLWQAHESIEHKRLLIFETAGLGDIVQSLRYLPRVMALSPRKVDVILGLRYHIVKPLIERFTQNYPNLNFLGVDVKIKREDYDRYLCAHSLAWRMDFQAETLTPARKQDLSTPPPYQRRWQDWLVKEFPQPHQLSWPLIALNFGGDNGHANAYRRNISLRKVAKYWGTLFQQAECRWVLIQKDFQEGDREVLEAWPQLKAAGDLIRDLGDSAAILNQADLLVTIDSAPAHLAGYLERPQWLILPKFAEPRWLDSGDKSVWYPQMKIWRQEINGEWEPLLVDMALTLAKKLKTLSSQAPVLQNSWAERNIYGD